MAQSSITQPTDAANTGKLLDTFTTSGTAHHRESVVIADPATDAAVASVTATNGLQVDVTRIQGSVLAGAPVVGQGKVAVTGTAVQLGANALTIGVIVTAKSTNGHAIIVGGAGVTNTFDGTGNGYILEAGQSVSFALDNTNRLYINGTAGDLVSFAGS